MKNAIILIAAFVLVAFSSCKGDYNCVCNFKSTFSGLGENDVYPLKNTTRKEAKKNCVLIQGDETSIYSGCTLK